MRGSGPLVTALTAATLEAATDHADVSAGGRMRTPPVGILDEAANVCRWRDLPDLYTHLGSREIPIMSVFQSWSRRRHSGVDRRARSRLKECSSRCRPASAGGDVDGSPRPAGGHSRGGDAARGAVGVECAAHGHRERTAHRRRRLRT
jgi:hypothetical protein